MVEVSWAMPVSLALKVEHHANNKVSCHGRGGVLILHQGHSCPAIGDTV